MKCFYHSADLDGHCSGAIVKHFHPECEMVGINYGDDFPWETIQKGEKVYMVDFCLQPFSDMVRLAGMTDLVWIDHHISAIKEYQAVAVSSHFSLEGARSFDNSKAGCELAWEFFTDCKTPRAVSLLSKYDVWNHEDPDTLPFQFGMRQYETIPEAQGLWVRLLRGVDTNPLDEIIKEGMVILGYKASEDRKYADACAFETSLDGMRCIAINRMLTNSQMFDSVWDNTKYDAMLTFGFRKGSWTVSLYTDLEDVDVSLVAKGRGGGGHKQAAGFQCAELPFRLG